MLAGGPCRWQAMFAKTPPSCPGALRMIQTHSFRPEALRGKRLAQGHPASGDREIPALTGASKAQHPLGGWRRLPGAPYQESVPQASPQTRSP